MSEKCRTSPATPGLLPSAIDSNPYPSIPSLTGLRFFAAFFILFAHAFDWLGRFDVAGPAKQVSATTLYWNFLFYVGMTLFFVLSGFVIHYNYGHLFKTKPLGQAAYQFFIARFARLYPLYFFFLVLAIFADGFVQKMLSAPHLVYTLPIQYLTLTQSWLYGAPEGILASQWVFGLSWSISVEVFFYVAYVPLVFAILKLKGPKSAFIASGVFTLLVTILSITIWDHIAAILAFAKEHVSDFLDVNQNRAYSFYWWLVYHSPYGHVFSFLLGCLIAQAFIVTRRYPVSRTERLIGNTVLGLTRATLAFVALCEQNFISTARFAPYIHHMSSNFLFAPFIGLIIFCLCRYDSGLGRLLSRPTIVLLGETSYSIYVVHAFTLRLFLRPPLGLTWLWGFELIGRVLSAIALTLIVSYATYTLIEMPARRWIRRALRPDRNSRHGQDNRQAAP